MARPPEEIRHFSLVNECRYLYLRHLSEPRDNSLLLVVQEAVVNKAKRLPIDLPVVSDALNGADAWPIESTEECRTFELYWERYAAYQVTEEMVGSCGAYEDEVYSGKVLRRYTKSHFLEHLARDTGGHQKPVLHYKLTCLNHLVDVAAEEPPEIRLISPLEAHSHLPLQ